MNTENELKKEVAVFSLLPVHSGDGYGYGGGAVVTIGDRSIQLGEGYIAKMLAEELARRWNAALHE